MMETAPVQELRPETNENSLEIPDHLDVAKVMKDKNAFFVHMIQVTNQLNVSENNKSGVDTMKLSVPDKLDIVYAASPTLSTSTVRPHTKDTTFRGGFGVIFSHGEIEHASTNDTGSTAASINERQVIGGPRQEVEDVGSAIDRNYGEGTGNYNEIILANPEVAGGFMKLSSYADRISYEDEEMTYYDGEKTVSKIGVIDMSNKKGGASYDVPFSVLQEMEKRGKVFVMDESNRIHIIRSIDATTRRVEFEVSPIDPGSFSEAYGNERVNKYHKREMKERLDASLAEKGMELK